MRPGGGWWTILWVQELIKAPDLESLGIVFDARLRTYVSRGSPTDERVLAERCAFEHEVRRYLTRVQERAMPTRCAFPRCPAIGWTLSTRTRRPRAASLV
jgi:hypothetical protein